MCYYNSIRLSNVHTIDLLSFSKITTQLDMFNPVINGFDYGNCLAIRPASDCDWDFAIMEWGFIPSWLKNREEVEKFRFGYKDEKGKFHPPLTTLNAVGEDLLQPGKMFRDAAIHRRCLVVSTGYFEWQHVFPPGKNGKRLKTAIKYPYFISLKGKPYFFMAAVWQPWTDRTTGETVDTCAIVTTKANSLMEKIHNSKKRMPLLLNENLAGEWISDGLSEERIAELATFQMPAENMEAYTIHKDFRTAGDPYAKHSYPELEQMLFDF